MSGIENREAIEAFNTSYIDMFEEFFGGPAPGVWNVFTEEVPVDDDRFEIPLIESLSVIRKWEGAKVVNGLRAFAQSLDMVEWEHTWGVERRHIDYDKLDIAGKKLRGAMQESAMESKDKIIFDELVSASGAGPTGIDGVALFSASHPLADASTQSNLTTSALSFDQYDALQLAAGGLKKYNGEPANVAYDTLVVGPKNRRIALEIAGGETAGQWVKSNGAFDYRGTTSGGTDVVGAIPGVNVFQGEVDVIVWNRLTGTYDDYYYMIDSSKPVKPMLLGVHRDFVDVSIDSIDSIPRFIDGRYLFGVEADLTPGPGSYVPAVAGVL